MWRNSFVAASAIRCASSYGIGEIGLSTETTICGLVGVANFTTGCLGRNSRSDSEKKRPGKETTKHRQRE